MAAFPEVAKIKYEGPDSRNPLAFRHYHADEKVEGKTMRDHLRFAVCYWHTFRGMGGDPFGPGCSVRPWEDGTNTHRMDLARVDVAFEFMEKLGVPYYCFHDRDISGEGDDLRETNQLLDKVVAKLKTKQQETGKKFMSYSGWKGGEKYRTVAQVRAKQPEQLIHHAVRGMIPKNRLGKTLLTKLKVYKGSEHPHAAQQPAVLAAAK